MFQRIDDSIQKIHALDWPVRIWGTDFCEELKKPKRRCAYFVITQTRIIVDWPQKRLTRRKAIHPGVARNSSRRCDTEAVLMRVMEVVMDATVVLRTEPLCLKYVGRSRQSRQTWRSWGSWGNYTDFTDGSREVGVLVTPDPCQKQTPTSFQFLVSNHANAPSPANLDGSALHMSDRSGQREGLGGDKPQIERDARSRACGGAKNDQIELTLR